MSLFDRFPTEQSSDKMSIVISRHWNNPQITITVNREKIELVMTLEQFIDSLISELDNKKIILTTKNKMNEKIKKTAKNVILKVQESTNQVMT